VHLIASILIGAALAGLAVGALLTIVAWRSDAWALRIGSSSAVAACLLGMGGAGVALARGQTAEWALAWSLPIGSVRIGLDPLTSFFLLCIFLVGGLAALYGAGYLHGYHGERRITGPVVGFNLLVGAMVLVVLARDAILFLVAWELMSVASYFLVTFESNRDSVRRAGTTYLIATHLGVLVLFALFALLARSAGSFAFADMTHAGSTLRVGSNLGFVLALIGFGTKAGFWPVHFWLPDAHPAAPSHVSALMSGVMIKLGLYGLVRVLGFLGPWRAGWGIALLAIGMVSGLTGVLLALSQRDLKRLLAYCSVENVGVVAIGLGLGVLGRSLGRPHVAMLGFAGALLHVLGHGLFKGLLFQGAGSVLHATGTRDIGSLGGLLRRMPITGGTFLVGAAAIAGLPPLNGFVSEMLIYLAAFRGAAVMPKSAGAAAMLVLPALALIGGLAAVCFIKAFGIVFLGEPRAAAAEAARETDRTSMKIAMMVGAVLCLGIGIAPLAALHLIRPAAGQLAGIVTPQPFSTEPLASISLAAAVLLGLFGLLVLIRARLLTGRRVDLAPTWGCGYSQPSPRMQYSATSFVDPIRAPFASILRTHVVSRPPVGYFPGSALYEDHVRDMAGERVLVPVWRRFLRLNSRMRVIQSGRMQLYLVYVLVTLVALLLWQMGGALGL
jgi:hydrogenase-4 component B